MKQQPTIDYMSVNTAPVRTIPAGANRDGLLSDHYERLIRSINDTTLLLRLYTTLTEDRTMKSLVFTLKDELWNRTYIMEKSASQPEVHRAMHEKERILDPIAKSIRFSRHKEEQQSLTTKQRADIIVFIETEMLRNLANLDHIAKRKDSTAEIHHKEHDHDKYPRVVKATEVKEHAQAVHQKLSTQFDKLRFLLHDEVQA